MYDIILWNFSTPISSCSSITMEKPTICRSIHWRAKVHCLAAKSKQTTDIFAKSSLMKHPEMIFLLQKDIPFILWKWRGATFPNHNFSSHVKFPWGEISVVFQNRTGFLSTKQTCHPWINYNHSLTQIQAICGQSPLNHIPDAPSIEYVPSFGLYLLEM